MKRDYRYITLRDRPTLIDTAAEWFHSKWSAPKEAYLECMSNYLNHNTEYGWYLCLDGDKIIGGLGVIENDFHDRKDLSPNVCAVYTEPEYRCQGIAGHLLNWVVDDLKSKGIMPVYLVTDHSGFYERYGWEFLCMVQGEGESNLSRMYIHRMGIMLQTERLILRPWREDDAETLYKYASDPEVGPRAGWPPHKSVEESLEVIRKIFSGEGMWAVVLKETSEVIGCVGYLSSSASNLKIAVDQAEVGYWIARPYWGKGICTEALRKVIEYCFQIKGFTALWGDYFPENPASGKVMEKCGFVDTGKEALCPNLEVGGDRPVRVMELERNKFKYAENQIIMKNSMIAYCGLDCEKCDAYIATKNNDQALREKTAKLWTELNNVPILPEHINCEGCRVDGKKTVYCESMCQIRQCALRKNITICSDCLEMKECPTLGVVIANNPEAMNNLMKK